MKSLIVAMVLLTGCQSAQYTPVADASGCRPVEGASIRTNKRGQPVYKYICNGQAVWSAKPV